jgi:hypothetical protein
MRGLRDLILEDDDDYDVSLDEVDVDESQYARDFIAQQIDKDAISIDGLFAKQSGGGLRKTTTKVATPKGERCLYVGPRGGKYIKISGQFAKYTAPKK